MHGRRRWLGSITLGLALAACGGSAHPQTIVVKHAPTKPATSTVAPTPTVPMTTTTAAPKPPPPPAYPHLLPVALGSGPASLTAAVRWRGQTAAWIARPSSGLAILAFNQRAAGLHLHSGTIDAGTLGWRYGPSVGGFELRRLIAAFNGGFRLSTGAGGFQAYGRVATPLQEGVGSIVSYSDGTSDVGSWHVEVPARGMRVVSVRQNLRLLIDHGAAAPNLDCRACWGATLGGVDDPARSGLGITADGRLVWAAGENLTVSQLADALLGARAVRAVELDINPEWVAGYLYGHRGGKGPVAPVPVLSSQHGIPGQLLAPWSRDFFTIVAR